ncbi:hypothetical protein CGRA01v4_14175 [Colletotrichum graminicola]|uniref:Uncharacterized protein n=1 Tax=Colletotrichum graminicola (strain M1.001 / M2 / FGSC 10212) TaxID=645133 RepID=E3Q514_COLGM|nr:uncharacterized protein GLRG_00925 [Colletotrichum graminicola M1.001]EFQ25781.1 hypothetical protein GLRG_00925 [Colletotrichum graminicola M1.001]WDK22884.1 hypothetical protein CGRA01v4_14175 [Colletotrichum graminicola]
MKFTLSSIAILLVGVASTAPTLNARAFGDDAITLKQADTGKFEPGTPVVDGALKLNEGESCTTTSTKGVLGCDDGTGGTFNIVNGKREDD